MSNENSLTTSLPLKGISELDFGGCLFINGCSDETDADTILKLESFSVDFAKREVLPLLDFPTYFSEETVNGLMEALSVISPLTLMLFFNEELRRANEKNKITPADMEAAFLERMNGRIRARYKSNLTNRNAREVTEEEEKPEDETSGESDAYVPDERAFGSIVADLFLEKKPQYVLDFLNGSALSGE